MTSFPWLSDEQRSRLAVLNERITLLSSSPRDTVDPSEVTALSDEIAGLTAPPLDEETRARTAALEEYMAQRRARREAPIEEPPPHSDADAPKKKDEKKSPASLGREFCAKHQVIASRGDLYVYRSGVYQRGGEALARAYVQDALGDGARKGWGDEVCYWLSVACRREDHELDVGPLVNVANGLLDWQGGELQPHNADVLSTVQLPTEWKPDAYHERADRFLDEVMPDRATRDILLEFAGYCLLGDCRYQRAAMLTGEGSNGKSVFLTWLSATLGADNVAGVKLQDLDHRFRAAELVGRLANISADIPRSAVEDSGPFKMLCTGDVLQVEQKFRDPFSFRNRAKLIFSANELPGTRDRSDAFFRRWLVIPFPRRFDPDAPGYDPDLARKLCEPDARSYLLRLAVDGLHRLEERGHFADSETTTRARAEYRRDADHIVAWSEESLVADTGGWIAKSEIYARYSKWCEDNGHPPVAANVLGRRLRTLFPTSRDGQPTVGGRRVGAVNGLAWGAS